MVSVIYASTLRLQSEVYDESKAVTLMTTDIDNIANNILNVQEIWARITEVGIGIWLLERQLGWVCVAPVIVTLGESSLSTAQQIFFFFF
jgi:ATP-binding cassette, subfamily C (CFTR/MRP), member 1